MTQHELIRKHEFDSIVPHFTAIDPENVPHNLYAFKEAFDDLRLRNRRGGSPCADSLAHDLMGLHARARRFQGRYPIQHI